MALSKLRLRDRMSSSLRLAPDMKMILHCNDGLPYIHRSTPTTKHLYRIDRWGLFTCETDLIRGQPPTVIYNCYTRVIDDPLGFARGGPLGAASTVPTVQIEYYYQILRKRYPDKYHLQVPDGGSALVWAARIDQRHWFIFGMRDCTFLRLFVVEPGETHPTPVPIDIHKANITLSEFSPVIDYANHRLYLYGLDRDRGILRWMTVDTLECQRVEGGIDFDCCHSSTDRFGRFWKIDREPSDGRATRIKVVDARRATVQSWNLSDLLPVQEWVDVQLVHHPHRHAMWIMIDSGGSCEFFEFVVMTPWTPNLHSQCEDGFRLAVKTFMTIRECTDASACYLPKELCFMIFAHLYEMMCGSTYAR